MKRKLLIPEGTRDYLPKEARETRKLSNSLLDDFQLFGYEEVITPIIEYLNVIEKKKGSQFTYFSLFDNGGDILSLRPEMTAPIARSLGTYKSLQNKLPVRLSYSGDVFSLMAYNVFEKRQKRQVGIELIGSSSIESDLEVLIIALESLTKYGIKSFVLAIGNIAIVEYYLSKILIDKSDIEYVKELMLSKNLVKLKNFLSERVEPIEIDKIENFVMRNGGIDFLNEIRNYCSTEFFQKEVDKLIEIYLTLQTLGYGDKVFFDFSILGDFEYYTGIVFEAYSTDHGVQILRGGRYDNLVGEYYKHLPAIGFGIDLDLFYESVTAYDFKDIKCIETKEGNFLDKFKITLDNRKNGLISPIDLEVIHE